MDTPVAAHRLGYRGIAALLVLAVLLVAALAALSISRSATLRRDGLAERFDNRHTTDSRFIEAYIDQTLDRQTHLARSALTGRTPQEHLDQIRDENEFKSELVLNSQGQALMISPANPLGLGTRSEVMDPALDIAQTGVWIESNILTPNVSAPVIESLVPFQSPTGRRVFIARYSLQGTPLEPFVKGALSAYQSGHAYLIDSHGTVLSSDQQQTVGRPLDQVSAPLATAISERTKGYFGQRSQRQHFVAGPIADTSWRLVFTLSTDELFQPFTPAQRWAPWLALVGFVLMSLGMIALFARALAGRVAAEDDHARQQAMLDTATDAFIGMDHRGTVVDWNTAASRLLGWTRTEAHGQSVASLLIPAQLRQAHSAGLQAFLDTGVPRLPRQPMIVTAQHRDGYEIPVEVTVSRTHWRGTWRFHAFMRDITDRLEHERQLHQMALTDALTGLANRRAFMDNLVQAHARFEAGGAPLTVLYADVDQFKAINDTYGHACGDAILIQIAERLRAHFRAGDTIGRLGGDEFAVICADVSMHPETLVELLRTSLAVPYAFRGQPIPGTVSVGLASPLAHETIEQLLDRADHTMYLAKIQRS